MKLYWKSESIPKQIIPEEYLFYLSTIFQKCSLFNGGNVNRNKKLITIFKAQI